MSSNYGGMSFGLGTGGSSTPNPIQDDDTGMSETVEEVYETEDDIEEGNADTLSTVSLVAVGLGAILAGAYFFTSGMIAIVMIVLSILLFGFGFVFAHMSKKYDAEAGYASPTVTTVAYWVSLLALIAWAAFLIYTAVYAMGQAPTEQSGDALGLLVNNVG